MEGKGGRMVFQAQIMNSQNIYEVVQNGKRRKQIVAGGKAGKGHQGTEP